MGEWTYLQVFTYIVLSYCMLGFLIMVRPFRKRSLLLFEVCNEVIVLVLGYTVVA